MTPPAFRGAFQELPQWRRATVAHLLDLERGQPGVVIVPTTIVDPSVFDDVVGAIQDADVELAHFTLVASPAVLRRRLRCGRLGPNRWALSQIDRCTETLQDARFGVHVRTDARSISAVTEAVATHAGLLLRPDHGSARAAAARRLAVQVRHVRFGG